MDVEQMRHILDISIGLLIVFVILGLMFKGLAYIYNTFIGIIRIPFDVFKDIKGLGNSTRKEIKKFNIEVVDYNKLRAEIDAIPTGKRKLNTKVRVNPNPNPEPELEIIPIINDELIAEIPIKGTCTKLGEDFKTTISKLNTLTNSSLNQDKTELIKEDIQKYEKYEKEQKSLEDLLNTKNKESVIIQNIRLSETEYYEFIYITNSCCYVVSESINNEILKMITTMSIERILFEELLDIYANIDDDSKELIEIADKILAKKTEKTY